MTTEVINNRINMDAPEQGNQTPPEVAIEGLANQLNVDHLDTARSATDAIQKAAFNSDNPAVRIAAIGKLSDFASRTPYAGTNRPNLLQELQFHAREKVAAIAFGSVQAEVRLAAVDGLAKSLEIPASVEEKHDNTIQLIAILGSTTSDNGVKNAAITALSKYATVKRDAIYGMNYSYPESQNYANVATSIVSNPAATPASAPVLP